MLLTNTLTVDNIGVAITPSGIAITPDGKRAYVRNTNTPLLSVIAMVKLVPHNNDDCKSGGYKKYDFPAFANQGQGLKYVQEHAN